MKNPGYLFELEDGSKAIAYHSQQRKEFEAIGKVLITHLDKDFAPILNADSKPKTSLKAKERLKVIGFSD